MAIKLLAIDLDGTTVSHDLTIHPDVLNAVHTVVHETDVKVVVATGRMHPSALTYVKKLQTPHPVISYQGGMVTAQDDDETRLHHSPIELNVAKAALNWLQQESINTNVYVDNHLYTNHSNDKASFYAKMAGVNPVIIDTLADALTDPPTKMMAITDDRIDWVQDQIRQQFGQHINCIQSRHDFCELIAHNASKWNAVKFLANDWNITSDEIMAIGDQENDLSMIEGAGLGIAMGNAPEWIRAKANHVAPTVDEQGLAKMIHQFILTN